MDRNLGSTYQGTITRQPQTKEDAVKLYGFQYQWGRKDPFPASGDGTNSKTLPVYGADNSEYTFPTAEVNDNGDNYLLNAVKNPTTFYYKTGGGDWTKQDNTLWTGSASDVFSPAPAGGLCQVQHRVITLIRMLGLDLVTVTLMPQIMRLLMIQRLALLTGWLLWQVR